MFRTFKPISHLFTFTRKNCASRLDRIYSHHAALPNILKHKHLHLSFSDHCLAPSITLKLSPSSPPKPTHWKLNDSILQCPETLSNINTFFSHILTSYSLPLVPFLCWENLKTLFKSHLIFFSKRKTLNQKLQRTNLQTQLKIAQENKDLNRTIVINKERKERKSNTNKRPPFPQH